MVKHYNPTIAEDANRIFNFKQGEVVTTEVTPFIVPVVPVQRKCNIVRTGSANNATSAIVFVTPSTKDFYLTGAMLSYYKDVTSDATFTQLRVTIDGAVQTPINMRLIALVAGHESIGLSFPIPIKVDRGSTITVNTETATANITSSATIYGYTVETTRNSTV